MSRASALIALLVLSALSGCIQAEDGPADDLTEGTPAPDPSPLYELPERVTGMKLLGASDVPLGAGIWVDGDHAYTGALTDGFYVTDISDPQNPTVVGQLPGIGEEGGVFARDVDLISYHDGRKVAVLAGQGEGMYFVDVTDPTMPELLSIVVTDEMKYDGGNGAQGMPTHNVAVVPGTSIVYNSPSGGLGRTNHILDAADPEEPKVIGNWGEHGCHDTAFFVDEEADKYRAYCAGRDITEIWDIYDPLDPKLLSSTNHPVVDNGGGLHHLAMVNQDASLLIIGDEFQGGRENGCFVDSPLADTPIGALWFFDIAGANENAPVELSHFSPTIPAGNMIANSDAASQSLAKSCTSHFGSFVGQQPVLAMGWYNAGVILIDLADPTEPRQLDQYNPGTNTWDVKFHRGVLITGDMGRGLDVLHLI